MKTLFIILISSAALRSSAQIKISYFFRDTCNDSLVTVPYELFLFSDSKNFEAGGKDVMLDSSGVYLFSTEFGEMVKIFCSEQINTTKGAKRTSIPYLFQSSYPGKMLSMTIQKFQKGNRI